MTREEQAKQIQEKRTEDQGPGSGKANSATGIEKSWIKKVNNGVVKSTVEGTVKSVLDEEEAKLENKPVIICDRKKWLLCNRRDCRKQL